MSNIDKIGDVLGKLYDRYIMRDLAHAFAGAFILVVVAYSFDQHLVFFCFISKKLLNFIIFLFFSYFIGLVLVEIPASIYKKKWSRIMKSDHNTDFPKIMKAIEDKYGFDPLRLIERFEYLRRIGSSVCATASISLIIIISKWIFCCYGNKDISVVVGIIFVIISSLRLFQRMHSRIEDAKSYYINQLEKNKEPSRNN